jgi:hypothetical protein
LRLAIVQGGKVVAAEPGGRPPSLIRYPYLQTDESLSTAAGLHYLAFAILMLTQLIHFTGQS